MNEDTRKAIAACLAETLNSGLVKQGGIADYLPTWEGMAKDPLKAGLTGAGIGGGVGGLGAGLRSWLSGNTGKMILMDALAGTGLGALGGGAIGVAPGLFSTAQESNRPEGYRERSVSEEIGDVVSEVADELAGRAADATGSAVDATGRAVGAAVDEVTTAAPLTGGAMGLVAEEALHRRQMRQRRQKGLLNRLESAEAEVRKATDDFRRATNQIEEDAARHRRRDAEQRRRAASRALGREPKATRTVIEPSFLDRTLRRLGVRKGPVIARPRTRVDPEAEARARDMRNRVDIELGPAPKVRARRRLIGTGTGMSLGLLLNQLGSEENTQSRMDTMRGD